MTIETRNEFLARTQLDITKGYWRTRKQHERMHVPGSLWNNTHDNLSFHQHEAADLSRLERMARGVE
jgi:hypothetical protein